MSSIAPQSVIKSLEVVGEIFKEENIKISVKESVKGGLITGIAALVGGLLGGKSGLIAGGVIGTVAACSMTQDFKSLLQIIHEMDYEKQKKLFDTIQSVISSIDISDVVKLMVLLSTSHSIKQVVIHETINFLRNEMSLEICRNMGSSTSSFLVNISRSSSSNVSYDISSLIEPLSSKLSVKSFNADISTCSCFRLLSIHLLNHQDV
ncbi:hypothetical protein AGLY_005021 [Aphis glycines]|uniref:Glycine zipper domain-containing protein n=1 Tax=Aphis glycines TaxID=307491 RepID=A0A6G0TXV1_APHGL|nr:hypothetical protein AGLY_005021 [Aphis glycines]